ncbi:hypothetical protein JKF63_05910 [Porcisia hertigi]|uniref:Uncharacterized protein n=1 Tax=Porcisia hertigi TaxID=2761500 RepID=A0A836LDG2_9TRYP|nr:hypothetical protein JKF63_05910 [Porcisia hertigi]
MSTSHPLLAMSDWWYWRLGRHNPFVDFSMVWIEPLIQSAVDFCHRIEPDVLCTLVYLACMGSAYLFHSPFRAHSTAAMDTYGRVTRVFQTWSTIVFFCFHLGPQVLKNKRQGTRNPNTTDAVPILFFPLFIIFTTWFGFLHKMKRRWGLTITYGGRFSVIALNSFVLAALGTVHCAYGYKLREGASSPVWRSVLYYVMRSTVATQPLQCIAKVLGLSTCFIAADYYYKKWMGFDPARGILWAELYELNKGRQEEAFGMEKSGKKDCQDWRELVPPPRVYARAEPSTHTSAVRKAAGARTGTLVAGRLHREEHSSFAMSGAPLPIEEGAPTHARPPSRTLYHECPQGVNLSVLESSYASDDAELRQILGYGLGSSHTQMLDSASSSTPQGLPFSRSLHTTGTSPAVHRVSHSDPTLPTPMSFRAPEVVVRDVQKSQHPVNRPGMVPWWSTFILFTVWQTMAGATLHFLAFDVRTIQGYTTPKIFQLHFFFSLRATLQSAAEALGHTPTTPPPSIADSTVSSLESCGVEATEGLRSAATVPATPLGSKDHEACQSNNDVNEGFTPAGTAKSPPTEPDVWFDWIADVGDGFNPTYAMARLLAQPALRLPLTTKKERRWRKIARSMSHIARPRGCRCSSCVNADGSLSASAATVTDMKNPMRHDKSVQKFSRAALASAAKDTHGSEPHTIPTTAHAPPLRQTVRRCCADAASAACAKRPVMRPVHGASWDRTLARAATTDSFASNTSVPSSATRRRNTVSNCNLTAKAPVSHSMPKPGKSGFVTLPRGSFVLVGGDLAYPSPNDETYTMRLFEPYHDAMSGNTRLQSVFHAEQKRVVVADPSDADVAHLHLLDAATVSGMATGHAAQQAGCATAEAALRSVPLLFAIPGNHDWFDGLTTYRKYIIEREWIGGWLMPQRSSFFVLRLPHNWFILCCDTGNLQDIDVAQRNYFLDAIEKYMDVDSCAILAAHEPGWILEAMERDEKPRQPEVNRVVEALGTRLRLRLAGDLHHYSRHVPVDASSEAATLVVSGGGGAFLHGARDDVIISQGTRYRRACAFPDRNTFMNMASRLWGFRVINWKFDLVVGFLCLVLLMSVLPLPMDPLRSGRGTTAEVFGKVRLAQVFSLWVGYTTDIVSHVITHGVVSLIPLLLFFVFFSSAGADRHAPLLWRMCYGAVWSFIVLLCCSGAMAFLHTQLLYLMKNGLLRSASGKEGTELEYQVFFMTSMVADYFSYLTGGRMSWVSRLVGRVQQLIQVFIPSGWLRVLLRCLDPFESLGYFSMAVSGGGVAQFSATASRLQIFLYYAYVLFFYWILITPVVSFLIGTFLLFSVTTFDYMYDGAYSAFQMEEYKHFVRFRLDAATRELHAYVVAVQQPAKVYQLDPNYLWGLTCSGIEKHRPPHLKQYPSRWRPVQSGMRHESPTSKVVEHFTVCPHRVPPKTRSPPGE